MAGSVTSEPGTRAALPVAVGLGALVGALALGLSWSLQRGAVSDAAAERVHRSDELAALARARLAEYRAAVDGHECGTVATTPVAAPPPADGIVVPEPASGAPARVTAAGPANPAGATSGERLSDRLRDASVFVLVRPGNGGTSSGSGFFVAPGLVLTNAHVVESVRGSAGGRVEVRSARLGKVREAAVVAFDHDAATGTDFALLQVSGDLDGVPSLAFAAGVRQAEPLYVGGFPGVLLDRDAAARRALGGDPDAVPSFSVSAGHVIVDRFALGPAVDTVVHDASSAPGNSGGAIVNACGQLLGVHTAGAGDASYGLVYKFGLGPDAIVRFLDGVGAAWAREPDECEVSDGRA